MRNILLPLALLVWSAAYTQDIVVKFEISCAQCKVLPYGDMPIQDVIGNFEGTITIPHLGRSVILTVVRTNDAAPKEIQVNIFAQVGGAEFGTFVRSENEIVTVPLMNTSQ
jgi:hypothetical protein